MNFRLLEDLDLVSNPFDAPAGSFEEMGSKDNLFSTYIDNENLNNGASAVGRFGIGDSGLDNAGGGSAGGSTEEEMNSGGANLRHKHSNFLNSSCLLYNESSIDAKKAMAPIKLAELWTLDSKCTKRLTNCCSSLSRISKFFPNNWNLTGSIILIQNELVEAAALLISHMQCLRLDNSTEKLGECHKVKPKSMKMDNTQRRGRGRPRLQPIPPTEDRSVPPTEAPGISQETTTQKTGMDREDRLSSALEQFAQAMRTQTRPEIIQADQALERFLRFQPPKFFGEPDDLKAEAWLAEMENIFKTLDYPDDQRIKFAVFQFEDAARSWWQSVEFRWAQRQTEQTWANFLEEFTNKYMPPVVRERREDEFNALHQGNLTVAQYEARFSRLVKYAPYMMTDETRRTRKFLRGLRKDIQQNLLSHNIQNYTEAMERALRVESGLIELEVTAEQSKRVRPSGPFWQSNKGQGKYKFQKPYRGGFRPQTTSQAGSSSSSTSVDKGKACGFCGSPGHQEARCWRKLGRCVRCGSDQHYVRDCPQPPKGVTYSQPTIGKASTSHRKEGFSSSSI